MARAVRVNGRSVPGAGRASGRAIPTRCTAPVRAGWRLSGPMQLSIGAMQLSIGAMQKARCNALCPKKRGTRTRISGKTRPFARIRAGCPRMGNRRRAGRKRTSWSECGGRLRCGKAKAIQHGSGGSNGSARIKNSKGGWPKTDQLVRMWAGEYPFAIATLFLASGLWPPASAFAGRYAATPLGADAAADSLEKRAWVRVSVILNSSPAHEELRRRRLLCL